MTKTEMLLNILKLAAMCVPLILLAWINTKANLKKNIRSRQFLMPLIAVVFCIAVMIMQTKIFDKLTLFISEIPDRLESLAQSMAESTSGASAALSELPRTVGSFAGRILSSINLNFWIAFIFCALVLLVYVIFKKIVVSVLGGIFKTGNRFYEAVAKLLYEYDTESGNWYIKKNVGQARTFLKSLYVASVLMSVILMIVSAGLYKRGLLITIFCPVYCIILVGEMYFYICGITKKEAESAHDVEEDSSKSVVNYSVLRDVLRKLFGDKLNSENTTVNTGELNARSNDEVLSIAEDDQSTMIEAYGKYMRAKVEDGLELDQNYFDSGKALLEGESILFNNPFYYDLVPYIFFPINRALLRHKKVLVLIGRHGIEEDVENWCREGLTYVTHIPTMWNIGLLTDEEQELDVGIITRSDVHNLKLHEKNEEFFSEVEYVVLVEPSKLVTTAQIGLNSVVRHCRRDGKELVFCSMDKNCDGLVDALSHMLMTSLSEVSATNRHRGFCSYMCWETDDEHLQHRMLPNLSRYLGLGTELSFVALKNQVSKTRWYGGEAFPVVDMHWIVKQYYYDLLNYANLPANQAVMDESFVVSSNLWNARVEKKSYITVEDESFNMFEVKRDFSTRATEQSFINVISSEYMLKDYMADNDGIFDSDPKAIPYIVADYAHTARNVILRLCLRMCSELVSESEIDRELMLIEMPRGVNVPLREHLWHIICQAFRPKGAEESKDIFGNELLEIDIDGAHCKFLATDIKCRRRYSVRTGKSDTMYFVTDPVLKGVMSEGLTNAEYLAEDESGERSYLGTELSCSVFQKHLPGQFFTFSGKYYEMLRMSGNEKVIVRRAADHITGRPMYRQNRKYTLSGISDSKTMGDRRDINGLVITKQYADIKVETDSYWRMNRYNDFESAKKVVINGVPDRNYYNKQVIRIDFPDGSVPMTKEICSTLAVLFNEVYRTLFAENADYIVAVAPGETVKPATYSLELEGDVQSVNCIYLIEDSQLDLGLLISAERNIGRVMKIVCDYLDWHFSMMDKSLNPPPDPDWSIDIPPEEEKADEEESKGGVRGVFSKVFGKVGSFFKKIGSFFKKIFGRKKKDGDGEDGNPKPDIKNKEKIKKERPKKEKKKKRKKEEAEDTPEQTADLPADGEETESGEEKQPEDGLPEDSKSEYRPTDTEPENAHREEDDKEAEDGGANSEKEASTDEADEPGDPEEPEKSENSDESEKADESEETPQVEIMEVDEIVDGENKDADDAPEDDSDGEHPVLFSINPEEPYRPTSEELGDLTSEFDPALRESPSEETISDEQSVDSISSEITEGVAETETETETDEEVKAEEKAEAEAGAEEQKSENPASEDGASVQTGGETSEVGEPIAEVETAATPADESEQEPRHTVIPQRKPYYESNYLYFGGSEIPEGFNIADTFEYLKGLGLDNGALKQARKGKNVAENIEKTFEPGKRDASYCDFCGRELIGTEYDELSDGRQRCTLCSRTAVKTQAEFEKIYRSVVENMRVFYNVKISVPVRIEMVNAKKLHKKLNKTFIPTSDFDGRVLGVAIKDRKGAYTILLENGAPRLQSTMTMVHELTHIWQYLNWDMKAIQSMYGSKELEVYEGMAKWSEIQYAYLINEPGTAKREEIITKHRNDAYGIGFLRYAAKYGISSNTHLSGQTPFENKNQPL